MPGPDLHYAIGLRPEAALAYLAGQKDYVPSFDWHSVWEDAHARAFTVAKAMQVDLLKDIHSAVRNGMAKGLTVRDFRKTLEPELRAKGWWGRKTMTDPLTGREKTVQLGSPRRLELIYRTNMAAAESAGRYKDFIESAPERPYWQYLAVLDAATRPSHRALHGKVFLWNDPFWNTFWPPLDWGCRCMVRKLTAAQVRRMGLKVESSENKLSSADKLISKRSGQVGRVSTYTDPVSGAKVTTGLGFDYNPGQAWSLDAQAWRKAGELPEAGRRAFLADMAKNNLAAEMWPSWVDGVLSRKRATGFSAAIGWMKPSLLAKLEKQGLRPQSPLIIANDKQLLHMHRPVKHSTGQALSLADLKSLPRMLKDYDAVYYDTIKGNLLYVVRKDQRGASKAVVEVDYNLRGFKDPVNLVKTAANLQSYHLGEERYLLLEGGIK